MTSTLANSSLVAAQLLVTGCVQGVGVRPAVARLAQQYQLTGSVRNAPQGVLIDIAGAPDKVAAFERELPKLLPHLAAVQNIAHRHGVAPQQRQFVIEASSDIGPLATIVPVDIAVCQHCLLEIDSSSDRRAGYPFTSCVACGPRFSILQRMPFDRASTSMASFSMCPACDSEYASPADRRFHAQTNACDHCGPQLWLADAHGVVRSREVTALSAAATAIRQGHIVAICGIGGYQLLVDATNDQAIAALRLRKHRPAKPLAVMVTSATAATHYSDLSCEELRTLTAPSNPIVVAMGKPAELSRQVSGQFNTIGVMLPTTPLHHLLIKQVGRPIVATSGNCEDEPLAYKPTTATTALGGVADFWLHHNRAIVRPLDDSVVRVMAGRAASLRLARGLAPLPLVMPTHPPALAVGGDLKSAIALANGQQAILGPHVGDLHSAAVRQRWQEQTAALIELYGERPRLIAHDLHPDFFTTRWAREQGLPTVAVQHHHAHAVAAMLQNDWLDRQVLAVVGDGTGYGSDGTIWGGEGLVSTATEFTRVAHLRPFGLPGGETAIRQPWRVAISLLSQIVSLDEIVALFANQIEPSQVVQVARLANHPRLTPVTTSFGRLFDAVAALILGIQGSQFEGQLPMLLEAACDASAIGTYALPLDQAAPATWDWRPLLCQLLADRAAGAAPGVMAMRFHRAVAAGVDTLAKSYPHLPVVLGGGVFQNRVLVEMLAAHADTWPQPLGLPGEIPPGDGGLAAGQLAVALARNAGGK